MRSEISICMGAGRLSSTGAGEGGGERESRARCGGCGESAGLAGPRGCCAGRADQYLALPGRRRARPSASRTTCLPVTPHRAHYSLYLISYRI